MGKAGLGAACSSLTKNFSHSRSPIETVLLSTGKSYFSILFFGQKWPNAWKPEHFGFEGLVRCFMRLVFRCLLFQCPCPPSQLNGPQPTWHPTGTGRRCPQPCSGSGVFALNLLFFFPPSLLALLTSLCPSCSGSLPHCQPLSLLLKVNSGTSIADAERSFLKGCCDWGTRLCFVPGLPCLPAPLCSSPAASPHRGVFLALQGADGAMLQQQQPPAAVGRRAGDGNAAHGKGRSLRRCAETPRSRR